MKLVLIGGGDIGRNDTKYETKEIDEEIVKLSAKDKPNFLFIGLASTFSDSYYKVIKNIYKALGCITGKISNKTIKNLDVVKDKINNADIIYIGGGDTVKLVNILKENRMDVMLKDALDRGSVMVGISAGAIAYLKYGLSDVEILNGDSDNYVKVDGLGFLNYMFVPHFSSNSKKEEDLKEVLRQNKDITALALDNSVALFINDDMFKIVKSKIDAKAYKISYVNDCYTKEELS